MDFNVEKIDAGECRELIVRTGDAPDIQPEHGYEFEGAITNVFQYLTFHEPDPKNVLISVDREKHTLVATVNPQRSDISRKIVGSLKLAKVISDLGLNVVGWSDPAHLAVLFRKNLNYFPDREDAMVMITALKNFEAKVDSMVQKKSGGNAYKNSVESVAKSNLNKSIRIQIPLFASSTPEEYVLFYMDVEVRAEGSSPKIYLIVDELDSMIQKVSKEALDSEVRSLEEAGYLVLEK